MTAFKHFSEYKGRRALMTNGLGLVGSNLARQLFEIGGVEVTIYGARRPVGTDVLNRRGRAEGPAARVAFEGV